jgi:ACR3 family arsenite efflux pump ArsB
MTAASVVFLLLVRLASIFVGAEVLIFFIHFADWTFASFISLSGVLAITIGLPLVLAGLLSIWAAISVTGKHWRHGRRTMANSPWLHG